MDDELRARIGQQIRERSMLNNAESEANLIAQFRQQGLTERADETVRMFQVMKAQRIEEEVARTLPFAMEIAERDGVTDLLSDDQCHEAGLRGVQLQTQNLLATFEARLQNATNMSLQRRGLAERFLAMSKSHTQMMNERFADVKNITGADLEGTARIIADDIGKLSDAGRD
jgi:hypothetical protein